MRKNYCGHIALPKSKLTCTKKCFWRGGRSSGEGCKYVHSLLLAINFHEPILQLHYLRVRSLKFSLLIAVAAHLRGNCVVAVRGGTTYSFWLAASVSEAWARLNSGTNLIKTSIQQTEDGRNATPTPTRTLPRESLITVAECVVDHIQCVHKHKCICKCCTCMWPSCQYVRTRLASA